MRRCLRLVKFVSYLLLFSACMLPLAWAAPPVPPLVAIILPRDNTRFQVIHETFLRNFEKIVTTTGKPRIYLQSPSSDIMSLRNSIRKATALGADLIVVYGSRAATAAKFEDFTEPLIFVDVFDPVAMELVPSLEQGGTLMTGVCGHGPLQTLLKALQETMGTIRLGVPVEQKYPASKHQTEALRKAACRRDSSVVDKNKTQPVGQFCWLEVIPLQMTTPEDMVRSLKGASKNIDAIYLSDLLPTDKHVTGVFDFATQAGLPVISLMSGAAEKGALMSLEADPEEQGELLASISAHMLDGDLPEDVPVLLPRRVSLIINLKVAKQLGIEVPFPVMLQTTRVIR